jgi:hypothetical protein
LIAPSTPVHHPRLMRREWFAVMAFLALTALAVFGPPIAQPPSPHGFADQQLWLGIPHALDVLTNLPFALWGCAGLLLLVRARVDVAQRATAALFFIGLLSTAAGSAYYHWAPDNASLAVDRLGMVLAFAGLLALAMAERVSSRAALVAAPLLLVAGAASVWAWTVSGNVLAWAVVQFGGMGVLLWLACCPRLPGRLAVRWGWVLALYVLAKGLELADHPVHALTAGLVSGHNLKHVVASLAAWPVLQALWLTTRAAAPGIHTGNTRLTQRAK